MYPTARWSTFPTPSTPSSPASLARLERQHPHPGLLRVHRHQRTGIQLVTHSSQRLEDLIANLVRQNVPRTDLQHTRTSIPGGCQHQAEVEVLGSDRVPMQLRMSHDLRVR